MGLYVSLAAFHHLLAFSVIALLFTEATLMRRGANIIDIKTLAKVDTYYGITSVLLIGIGIARVVWGEKGWEPYVYNWVFWAKMGCYVLAGILSVPPTISFIKWRKQLKSANTYEPLEIDANRVRTFIKLQFLAVLPIPVLAAMMARGIGY
jgi:putative membrane protein